MSGADVTEIVHDWWQVTRGGRRLGTITRTAPGQFTAAVRGKRLGDTPRLADAARWIVRATTARGRKVRR
jgi:hypothetical protein